MILDRTPLQIISFADPKIDDITGIYLTIQLQNMPYSNDIYQ